MKPTNCVYIHIYVYKYILICPATARSSQGTVRRRPYTSLATIPRRSERKTKFSLLFPLFERL